MTKYVIITRRVKNGTRSRMEIDGCPATTREYLTNVYAQTLYKEVKNAHLRAIRFGDLEEITTTFNTKV